MLMLRLLVVITLFLASTNSPAIEVTDDAGNVLQLQTPAQRLVSLAPHLTELLYAVNAGEKIVGTVEYSNYPDAAKLIPRVGSGLRFDVEAIIALRPDLVFAWKSGNPAHLLQRLQQFGIKVYVSEPGSLEAIATSLQNLGELTGNNDIARRQARQFRQEVARLSNLYKHQARLGVFHEVSYQPLITIGANHVINDVMKICGARNVFDNIETLAPFIDIEAVLVADPDVITVSGFNDDRPESLDKWKQWQSLRAVKEGNLFYIPPDIFHRHTPRILLGAKRLCEALAGVRKKRAD